MVKMCTHMAQVYNFTDVEQNRILSVVSKKEMYVYDVQFFSHIGDSSVNWIQIHRMWPVELSNVVS